MGEQVTHNLRVRLRPEIETSPSEVVMVEEGDPLYLQCNILAGSPIPSIRWRRCGGEVLTENQMYSIKNIRRDEAGCYSCEADNGFRSTPVSQEVTVIVQYAPEVTLQKLGDSSDNVTLICNVESQPGADVVIYRDKTPLFICITWTSPSLETTFVQLITFWAVTEKLSKYQDGPLYPQSRSHQTPPSPPAT